MHHSPSAIQAGFVLAQEPDDGGGPQWVAAQAEAEIVERYGILEEGELGLTGAMFNPPNGAFLVARGAGVAGPPVGGVGVRAIHPGIGQIRDAARELGLTALRLGTGDRQPEAVALYESTGWERVLAGNDGRPLPPRHIWFVKQLGS